MYTDEKLRKAVLELLNEIPADRITIKSVCERAGVSRPSFYYHFNNMSELVWSCFNSMQRPVVARSSTDPADWVDNFAIISAVLRQNRKALQNIYNSKMFGSVITLMAHDSEQNLLRVIEQIVEEFDLDLTDDQQLFFARFYRAVQVSMLLRYIEEDAVLQPHEFRKALELLPNDPIMLAVRNKVEQFGDVSNGTTE